MTTTGKTVRWAKLDNQEKAKQFSQRGLERTARNDLDSNCVICNKGIAGGDLYLDVNGARSAHKLCVTANLGNPAKHSKVITHKMMDALSATKSVTAKTAKVSKHGRKPKTHAAATVSRPVPAKRGPKPKVHQTAAAAPTINLSEIREALPGAVVTLTITGTVEAVQRALDKLQN